MSKIELRKLVVIGTRKNYEVPFFPGLNIILGDSDTGKSSILELINYSLGASEISLYSEIEATGLICCLELDLDGNIYTFKRNLFNYKAPVVIYACPFTRTDEAQPAYIVSPSYKNTASPDGYLSDFIFDRLGFPLIKIKEAPKKDNSRVARLSFRDLMKHLYLNQDDVGSKYILDQNVPYLAVKNREVFKFIFNFLDEEISALQIDIAHTQKKYNDLEAQQKIIINFLQDTELGSLQELDETVKALKKDLIACQNELENLNKQMQASVGVYAHAREKILELESTVKKLRNRLTTADQKIFDYAKLKNEYIKDIDKLKTSSQIKPLVKNLNMKVSCPVCSQEISAQTCSNYFNTTAAVTVDNQIRLLKQRKTQLLKILDSERIAREEVATKLLNEKKTLDLLRQTYDNDTKKLVTPFIQERDAAVAAKTMIEEKIKHYGSLTEIVKKSTYISEDLTSLSNKLKDLRKDLKERADQLESPANVFSKLDETLGKYLRFVSIKNATRISISEKTCLPKVRDTDYSKLSSGGLRTITSIGYVLSLLEYSLTSSIRHPGLVLIDTVGKYLGKYTKHKYLEHTITSEDKREYVSDPHKYGRIYEHMLKLVQKSEETKKPCQIIVVDNDLPEHLAETLSGHVVIEFDANEKNGLPKGLIDDA